MSFLWFILIGALSGYLAGLFMRGGGMGFIWNLILGVLGGVIGGWLFDLIGFSFGGTIGSIFTSVVGAVVLLYVVNKISNQK